VSKTGETSMHRYSTTSALALTLALTLGAAVASAADLGAPAPAPIYTKAPMIEPWSWTGFYVGGNVGYSWGNQSATVTDLSGDPLTSSGSNLNGVIGGGQIGYNYQFNSIVLGIEADIQGSGQKGDGSFGLPGSPCVAVLACIPTATLGDDTDKLAWFGTVRARLGYAAGRLLPYVTGGWAYGNGTISGTTTTGSTATTYSSSTNYTDGWTVGGGLEWAFTDHWSAKFEYLYVDFGSGPIVPISPTLNLATGHMTDNIGRVGVNYRFY
jgi:outer membrane immunogenic protein